jgi:hypothetical protein
MINGYFSLLPKDVFKLILAEMFEMNSYFENFLLREVCVFFKNHITQLIKELTGSKDLISLGYYEYLFALEYLILDNNMKMIKFICEDFKFKPIHDLSESSGSDRLIRLIINTGNFEILEYICNKFNWKYPSTLCVTEESKTVENHSILEAYLVSYLQLYEQMRLNFFLHTQHTTTSAVFKWAVKKSIITKEMITCIYKSSQIEIAAVFFAKNDPFWIKMQDRYINGIVTQTPDHAFLYDIITHCDSVHPMICTIIKHKYNSSYCDLHEKIKHLCDCARPNKKIKTK